MSDQRQPIRIIVDVLATPEQVQRLQELIGETLCGAPHDHVGPCRVAWSISHVGGPQNQLDGSYGLDPAEAELLQQQLTPVPVWPHQEVDRSLGLTPSAQG